MVKIIADSTCDLSQELIQKYNITILPLHVLLGDKDYKDKVDISTEELYRWADDNKTTPKTSAPSPQEVMDALESLAENDIEILCFSVSGKMSSTFSVMNMAREEVENEERIYVFDSQNLSTGIGLLMIEAALMAEKGKSAKQITDYLETIKEKVRVSFVVDTLTYLHRGGRCNAVAALRAVRDNRKYATQEEVDCQVVEIVKTQHKKAVQILMRTDRNWMNWHSSSVKKRR